MGNPFGDSSSGSSLRPDSQAKDARGRSPSGFSLRRSLSGRSQRSSNDSGDRRGLSSIFSNNLFSSNSRSQRGRGASPPPPYSPAPAEASGPIPNAAVGELPDDQYAFLREFNTIFLIDDSLSMKVDRRWAETQAAVAAIVPICVERDEDGVDVYFLNHKTADGGDPSRGAAGTGYRSLRDAKLVTDLFDVVRPSQATPTGTRLDQILRAYLTHYDARVRASAGDVYCVRPINVIVITDGQPTDEPGEIIAAAARRLDRMGAPPHQVGVQFFQVGRDPGATRALRDLDDELCRRESIRDMVDTATFNATGPAGRDAPSLTADGILKVVLGAVKRKLDRKVLVRVDGPPGK
ncbi:uncharacterized protein F4812DRAFT_455582 [Daldinia caldariorum]|uniref:uncharacterized protein n=1 Tax=Daldinia caldariorum TaxID=326644 RepID=UPI002008C90A|nr:uncharacterized protein F4812DRAFT_455582 [Daldinia caldariorum]KAI1471470.1 hypothetical protein F4812DRAFT_455582 [Daldinia caldariorum]